MANFLPPLEDNPAPLPYVCNSSSAVRLMNFFKSTLSGVLGTLIGGGIIVFLLFLIISNLLTPKPDELVLEEPTLLKMDLKGTILEKADQAPFRMQGLDLPDLGSSQGLYEIRKGLEAAAEDDQIAGLYLNLRGIDGGWATVTSLREALLDFKAAGKSIYAWSDRYDERSLYLASVADHLYLHPVGDLEVNGFAATPYYLRNMLDKFGLEVRTFRVGTYKAGVEPYRETEMSPASREQLSELLFDLWYDFRDSLAASRSISPEQVDAIAASFPTAAGPTPGQQAGLVDELWSEVEVRDWIKDQMAVPEEDRVPMVTFKKYQSVNVQSTPLEVDKDKIAVIFMEGEIVGGEGGSGQIGGDQFVREIRKARLDSTVKAVVLRINSPGGSSLASDLMAEEIKATREVKPVIASMGDVAASGGYYIAAPCNRIFARSQTITGSIGVYSLSFRTQQLLEEQIGVNYDRVTTHPMADMNSPYRPMTEDESVLMQASVENTYHRFIDLVKEGRGYESFAAVDSIAQGRVWSGKRAKDLGLVDELGGLDQAIEFAIEESGSESPQLWLLPDSDSPWQQLAEGLSVLKIEPYLLGPELQTELTRLEEARKNHWKPGIYMRMDMDLDIR